MLKLKRFRFVRVKIAVRRGKSLLGNRAVLNLQDLKIKTTKDQ